MEDFRIDRKMQHLLGDIITVGTAAMLCGCSSYDDMGDFALVRDDWFKTFLALPWGIPSHDTINREFAVMDPPKFEKCFRNWMDSVLSDTKGQLIRIDEKTIRGAKSHGGRSPSMW
ncbi:ISAs1 family transposase [Sphingobacterium sp. JB170]|uniref:ISAs1 family transposase n=1 Tax=Sphingobacterium sp. JB170 TaxID=1434842 RepID=UPI001C4ED635|nr:ISAs1 family transposase [Sphingobacterium sp. JB170]